MPSPLDILNGGSPPYADTIILGGERCPGLATPVKAGSPRKWDRRDGYGISGASLIYIGDELSEFDVIVELWEDKHWAQWRSFASKVLDKPVMTVDPRDAKAVAAAAAAAAEATVTATAIVFQSIPLVPARPKALGIYHPLLAMPPLRITEVVVKDFTQFEQDEWGMWTGTIQLQVYRPPRPILGKAREPTPAASKPVPTAQDAADREIVALTAELRAL